MVLATNRPADLDPAVLDRMDEALEFPLPGPVERARILDIYLNSYIAKAGSDEGTQRSAHFPLVSSRGNHKYLCRQEPVLWQLLRKSLRCCCAERAAVILQRTIVGAHMGVE